PASQNPRLSPAARFIVRSEAPLAVVIPAVQHEVENFDRGISMRFEILKNLVTASVQGEQLMATLSVFFGLLALVLSAIGLYGVVSYITAQRRNEIGLRMALGAQRTDISRMIFTDLGLLLAAGAAAGVLCALPAGRTARSLLFGLEPDAPHILAIAV